MVQCSAWFGWSCPTIEELERMLASGEPLKIALQPDGSIRAVPDTTAEVVSWAQCVLTALNVGDVKSGSLLHLKLREVMIAHRASKPEPPNS
jgi:hypothetical protein